MKKLIVFLFVFAAIVSYSQTSLRLDQPPAVPELVSENMINTGSSERDFALSPDGMEIFYTLQSPGGYFQTILYMKKDKKGNWSKPEVAPFAGKYSDLEPAFSIDGQQLFFASNRPVNGSEVKDFDIWVVQKTNGTWGEPKNAGAPVNTSADEYYPSVARNGNLYFTAAYKNAVGKEDIYVAAWEGGKYKEPVPLDTAVNSKTYEFNAFVSPDEDFIIFTSYGRKDDKGRGDLYMSVKDPSGKWQPARNLSFLNSEKLDYCPFVSFDKKVLFFTSERVSLPKTYIEKPASYSHLQKAYGSPRNGGGDIYWVSFAKLMEYVR